MSTLAKRLAGKFLVIDGPDGAGKSTQMDRVAAWLSGEGVDLLVTRDPGGTAIGERVRSILLDPGAGEMSVACEIMLYMASRAQLMDQVVRPALAGGRCVLCDRFVSATVAYQGAGGANVEDILKVADVAIGHTWPDLTVILDIDPGHGLSRVKRGLDRMEAKGLEFHRRVREAFLTLARQDVDRFVVIEALGGEEQVFERVRRMIEMRVGQGLRNIAD